MNNNREEVLSSALSRINTQLYKSSIKPLQQRLQSIIHSQFLKIKQWNEGIKQQKLEQSVNQLQQSDFVIDKDKFIPSQDLLNKFQQLYPFSINEVQKVIPQYIKPMFDEPNYTNSNPFLGITNTSNTSFNKPWIVQKKSLNLQQFCNNQLKNHVQTFQTRTSPNKFYQPNNSIQTNQVQKLQKIQSKVKGDEQQKNGLDYWKKKREQMLKSIK